MNTLLRYSIFGILWILVCSMSECERLRPDAETTVRGKLTDRQTGQPLVNVPVMIMRKMPTIDMGSYYDDYDSTRTLADGSYFIKFIPKGYNSYKASLPYYIDGVELVTPVGNEILVLGKENNVDFLAEKTVNVNLHVKNNSTQGRTFFTLEAERALPMNFKMHFPSFTKVLIDTVLKRKMIRLSSYVVKTIYYKQANGPRTDTLSFSSKVTIGKNDTTINIVNP